MAALMTNVIHLYVKKQKLNITFEKKLRHLEASRSALSLLLYHLLLLVMMIILRHAN